jgi:hypothetical protein
MQVNRYQELVCGTVWIDSLRQTTRKPTESASNDAQRKRGGRIFTPHSGTSDAPKIACWYPPEKSTLPLIFHYLRPLPAW